jgi:signal transduction histidine kinase
VEAKQSNKALKANLAALNLLKENNLKADELKATCLNNIGNSYTELNNFVLANRFLKEALSIKELQKTSPGLEGTILFNMATLRLRQKSLDEAKQLFAKALLISQKHKEFQTVIGIHIGLSDYYSKVNDTVKAIEYAQKAKNISIKENIPYGISESLVQLIQVDTKNASAIAQEYIKVNDNLQQTERQFRDKFARIALETDEIQLERDQVVKQKGIIISIAIIVFLIGLLFFITTKQRGKQKELLLRQSQQNANEEIYQLMLAQKNIEDTARQAEKKRIAMELHDGVMNKLTSTRLNLYVLSQKNDPETIATCLIQISQIHNIEVEIRNIAHDLNKDIFKKTSNFFTLLEEFVTNQNTTAKAQYVLEVAQDIDWSSISSEIKMNLYRIMQEASQNANKYSNATILTIAIVQDFNNICMSIDDNGVGFDPKTTKEGIGIQNMRQRVLLLKGKFTIVSIKKTNTFINISIPIRLKKEV